MIVHHYSTPPCQDQVYSLDTTTTAPGVTFLDPLSSNLFCLSQRIHTHLSDRHRGGVNRVGHGFVYRVSQLR